MDYVYLLRRRQLICSLVIIVFAVGCGSQKPRTYPVQGRVTYPDGEPITGGLVEFEPAPQEGMPLAERYNARGQISNDGSYTLTTFRKGDGAMPGRHRVIVQEPYPDDDLEAGRVRWRPSIDAKYRRYDESGLEFEVKPEENEINIVVTRPT